MERYQRTHPALGSTVLFTLVTDKGSVYAEQLLDSLQHHVDAFEGQFSRFRTDSELTKFNCQAGTDVRITPSFRRLLRTAKKISLQTKGLYNPFILPALQRVGYRGSWPNPEAIALADFTNRDIVPITQLIIRNTYASIPTNAAIDFGGIGKGYLLDELAARLRDEGLQGHWLALGGDIICAGQDIDDKAWRIGIQDAANPDNIISTITNTQGGELAIATSGITKRRGTFHGQQWHHIIDPYTGKPAETTVLTATVTASTGTIADVYAKVAVLGGAALTRQYKKDKIIMRCILQMTGHERTMEL